ncbi:GNAT family N-acetyltransferase [Microbacterium sp.]|uniref:GNAT family N-acetyltransferase n=1 Tax=Microbacterium sp. TaxID=51671 RepID=UPI003A8D3AB3
MEFRPLTEADLAVTPDWFAGIELRADRWRDGHTRSAVAVDSGQVVAVGIIWTTPAHNDRYWIDIVVDPPRRRHGIGTAMHAHLSTLRARDLPFFTRGYADEARIAFAYALGAHAVQIVPPADVAVEHRSALRADARVVAASTVPFAQVLQAHAAMYEWIHRSWSPVSAGFEDAVNVGLDEDLDHEASALALDVDGRVAALAAVYRDSDPPVVCAETTGPDQVDGERLVEGCLRFALDVLAVRGVERVEFDGHVSDPHLLPNWAKLAPAGRWFLLVEVPPATGL